MILHENIDDYFLDTVEENEDTDIVDLSDTSESVGENSKENSSKDISDNNSEEPKVKKNIISKSENEISFPHLIGKKIGMTQLFLDNGESLPTTVLEMGPCSITQIKNESKEGYNSVQLGFEDFKNKKINKSQIGHFSKSNVSPKKYLKEFKCPQNSKYTLGDVVTINQFVLGDFVKVTGTSKGKGFTGHMKRHGFGGGRRSHGKNSVMRKAGSIGAGSDPSRVFPGMKMAGRTGNYKITVKNLSVIKIDSDNNLIFVSGAVPGANNSLIYLSKI